MTATVVPPAEILPDVLPAGGLSRTGRPRGVLGEELRRIAGGRNVGSVAGALVQTIGVVVLAARIGTWWSIAAGFLLAGRGFALLNILGHEAAHKLLFSNQRANDVVGRWLLAFPALTPFDLYRRSHFAHHRDELGPEEPDHLLYGGYPLPAASLRRKLLRDAFFVSGWKNLRLLGRALRFPASRPVAVRILAAQVAVAAIVTVAGAWWAYPVLWLAPWMSVWRVLNRLRAIAEHGGMTQSDDRRQTTHSVRQSRLARFWMVPYNTGWHLAHHVDVAVPFRNLPRLHDELRAVGWITDRFEYPSYWALWRALVAEPATP